MAKAKTNLSKRLIASLLSVLMVLSIVPVSATTALAATDEHPDAVTITVKDENGNSIENADVAFTIDSQTNGDSWKSETNLTTDEYGCVEILSKADFIADDLTLTATVSKDGFETNETIAKTAITSDVQNFEVVLISKIPTGITVTGRTILYNPDQKDIPAVNVQGVNPETDTVTYTMDGVDLGTEEPKVTNVKRDAGGNVVPYVITVKVEREGKELPFESGEIDTYVNPADIKVDFIAKNPEYNETEQELVTVEGAEDIPDGSSVTWYLGENEYSSDINSVPMAMAVGPYKVRLTIQGNPNYSTLDITKEVSVIKGELNLDGLTVKGLKSKYKVDENGPVAQEAVIVTPESGHPYTLMYQLDDGDLMPDDNAWRTDIPTVTDAGSYIVWVKAVKDGYNESDVPVNPAAGAVAPYNVYIAKAASQIAFTSTNENAITVMQTELPKEFQYIAENQTYEGGAITYSVDFTESSTDDRDINEVAVIDSYTGKIAIYSDGDIVVKATLSETNNYEGSVVERTLQINTTEDPTSKFIKFNSNALEIPYTIGGNDGKSPFNTAELQNGGRGKITYSIDNGSEYGLSVYQEWNLKEVRYDYAVKVDDYQKLINALANNNGNLQVKVNAEKGKSGRQDSASTFYYLNISFLETPVSPYTLPNVDGSNYWYKNAVTVTPADGYAIAKTEVNTSGNNFESSVQFDDQGEKKRYIYLQEITTGKITNAIPVNIKIDTENPYDLKVEYAKSPLDEFLEIITLGFYNPSVTLRFTATDDTSGLDYLDWTYTRETGQSESNLETEKGTLTFADGKAERTLTASQAKQYRGNISFTVYDKAGNSTSATDDGNVFVVDTISPAMTVKYAGAEPYAAEQNSIGDVHYFNGSVEVELTVTEANFYAEDVKVLVSKDGGEFNPVTPDWIDNSVDVHIGTFTLRAPADHSGDGDYVIKVEYTDKSGNSMTPYHSETITIDTTPPEVEIVYSHNGDEQKTTFTVKEHNFRAIDVTVTGTMQDITGADIPYTAAQLTEYLRNAEWKEIETDTYQVEYDGLMNGIYNLKMDYKDLANWDAEQFAADEFIIDHDAPTDVKIEYSKSILDTVLKTITLGFYNPSVEVTFTATDLTSGVDSFAWTYERTKGASETNVEKLTGVVEKDEIKADGSTFTAKITLPKEVTGDETQEQLHGKMSVIATDAYNNPSDRFTDEGYVLVVDTISPKMAVEYSKESRMVGTTAYYNGVATVTFTVNEANFFPEDVVVSVSKDNAPAERVMSEWKDESVDVHIGTLTLPAPADHSGDGDYVIYVKYHDRSQNDLNIEKGLSNSTSYQDNEKEYIEYKSHTITIDTIKPVIDVEYQNPNVINTLTDTENHNRDYFDDTQAAIVTITEHNFKADEVNFKIIAKDVAGNELDASALNSKTEWSDSTGDVHTITITYPGDANYTFDVAYTDLATNATDDYAEDYFTVDKTAPTNLKVDYSTSVLDTVLESLTFGFYNAKMTVTLTADDITSGVHNFKYSYLNAAGVSSVNAELIDQAIDAADIAYSEDGMTATMTFEIPKMVLGTDNQFNGTVEFTAYDRADNETNQKDTKRIVVDNIAPTANVQYNTPVNEVNGVSYYDGDINATVTITEANFYANDVQVMVTKDGGTPYAVTPSWTDNNVDIHTGTFTLTEDGDYIITINYRDKSTNQMQTYTSNQLTVDTDIQAPTYSINGVAKTDEGGAYKNNATVAFSFEDQNFDTKTIKLERTHFNSVEDVTDDFIHSSDTDKGGSGSFEIPSEVDNDGIYVLTIGMTDKANHTTESKLKFTINRYGSVYEYSDYLTSLLEKQYIKIDGNNSEAVTQDLVITEYNANQILTDSLNILITRDGETIDTKYTSNPTVDSNAGIGDSGWYQYAYTIAKENFAEDGVYKITLTSAYAASDSDRNESTSVPENSIDAAGNQILNTMNFTVDTTKPEIRNIVNLDKPIVNAQTLDVDYTIVDVGGLKSIEVIVNGSTIDTITEFGDSTFNYSGSFTLNESSDAQTVQLKVTDIAGNVTDTASDDFSTNDLYVFNDTITVSTNFFVRWYANKPLFWGSIGGVVVLTGLIWFLIAFKRKKKEDKEEK